jgi:tRNA threonylcarbamoyladenosine biosynthesis protein TsaB
MAQGSYRKHGAEQVAVAIDARMSEVYWGRFQRQQDGTWAAVDAECVIPPAILAEQSSKDDAKWVTAGTGWEAYQEPLSALAFDTEKGEVQFPDAEDIVHLAKFEFEKGNTVEAEEASPTYLRDTVAWKKLPGRE